MIYQFLKKSKSFSLLLTLAIVSLFSGCKTTQYLLREQYSDPLVLPVEELCPPQVTWQEVKGTNSAIHTTGWTVQSANSQWKCIKIDLDTPELEITAAPENAAAGTEKRFYLSDFSARNKTLAAINTVPFTMEDKLYHPVSIVKINNKEIYPLNSGYSALGLIETENSKSKVYRAIIINSQNQEQLKQCKYAFGGFFTILEDSLIYEFGKEKRSRSAAGISDNGRYLYLFAGCGINSPTGRSGFNFQECALILQALGCTKAMEFDGGHSTGLTLKRRNLIKPSLQRKVPAAMGVKLSLESK